MYSTCYNNNINNNNNNNNNNQRTQDFGSILDSPATALCVYDIPITAMVQSAKRGAPRVRKTAVRGRRRARCASLRT